MEEPPVGNSVQRVQHNIIKMKLLGFKVTVGIIGGPCQGTASDGRNIHALHRIIQTAEIPEQHGGVGHQVMSEGYGLSTLQMGVSRKDHILVLLRLVAEHLHQFFHQCGDLSAFPAQIHAKIQGDLVIAAAGGVQHFSLITDTGSQDLLHKHMDILAVVIDLQCAGFQIIQNPFQPLDNMICRFLRDDLLGTQHGSMCHRARDILPIHAAVNSDGGIILIGDLVYLSGCTSGPHFLHNKKPLI